MYCTVFLFYNKYWSLAPRRWFVKVAFVVTGHRLAWICRLVDLAQDVERSDRFGVSSFEVRFLWSYMDLDLRIKKWQQDVGGDWGTRGNMTIIGRPHKSCFLNWSPFCARSPSTRQTSVSLVWPCFSPLSCVFLFQCFFVVRLCVEQLRLHFVRYPRSEDCFASRCSSHVLCVYFSLQFF